MVDFRRATRRTSKGLMTNVKCIRCGVVNLLSNEICRACGLELSSAPPIATYSETPQYPQRRSLPTISRIGPFNGIGDVLGPSITLFTRNLWLITKLTVVIATPFEIFKALSVPELQGNMQLTFGTFALQAFTNVLIAPALIYALMKVMQTGIAPGVNESYRWGLNRLGKLSVCALASLVFESVGLALCIIPGIFLFLAFELVYPMAVLEDRSPREILKRSYRMTKGRLLSIFGATFLMSLIAGLAAAPVTMMAAWLTAGVIDAWPILVVAAIIGDILNQSGTVLSLVIYLSILRTLESRQSLIE